MPPDPDHQPAAISWRKTAIILGTFVTTMLVSGLLIFGTFSILESIVH